MLSIHKISDFGGVLGRAPPCQPCLSLEAKRHATRSPNKIAVIDKLKKESFTYTCILEILKLGSTGDLEECWIAYLAHPGYDYVVTQWAIWAAGGIVMPLYTPTPSRSTTEPARKLSTISDSDPCLIILHPTFEKIETALPEDTDNTPFLNLVSFTKLQAALRHPSPDHLLHVLSLRHVHGIINGLTATLLARGTVEMYAKFEPEAIWQPKLKGTEKEQSARAESHALRPIVSGSAALPTSIKHKFADITGLTILECCGLEAKDRIDGSIVWPLAGVQVRLVNHETGKVITASEEQGMIEVKGENNFKDDIARRVHRGAYFIQGRVSIELLKSGGYKISALEVERKMLGVAGIHEVAVVGVDDVELG
ncbi:acetyl-CoA synthetase-like protein [Zopfia rhizophila CBS 207.26]|uniref:Acetyl-CoA synthetase-like protein n=1 Tax=Zopfia rhizophila CBS 207.26 TaxID=1314779 RepID=A0A6A6E7A5_9PEZI|nr:acetyl-CoA synthetase-like protein [Zopfia rhizophila CBS 207.26]